MRNQTRFLDLDTVVSSWPPEGSRNFAYQALIGGLLRSPYRWPAERVSALVEALTAATDDEEASARLAIVAQTAQRLKQGETCYGWPRLAELIGADLALSLRLAIDAALTVDVLAHARQLPPDYLRGLDVADAPDQAGYVTIAYHDAGGQTKSVRRRPSLETKPRWDKNTRAMVYGEDHLDDAVEAGYLTLVEGESDCWTLWFHEFAALGIPGAGCARVLQVGHVESVQILYIVQEVGAAAEGFVAGISRRLAELQWSGELHIIKMAENAKDPSALYIANPEAFAQEWRRRMETAEVIELPTVTASPTTPTLLPYQPFPVEALPAPLATFVRQGSAALGCDSSYFALPVLAAVASLIGNSRTIRLNRSWTEPSVVWTAIVGPSGSLKSPALRLVVSPLYRLQQELLQKYTEEKKAYDGVKAEYERAIKKTKNSDKPPDDVLPEPPAPGRILTGDTTIEKLGQLLADNPRGMLVCRDELRGWFASFTRYKGQAGGSDLPAWLEFFRAESVIIDRKTGDRPTLFIPRANVSICGGIQPETLSRVLTPEAYESGLVARLLVAMPPRHPKRWSEAEIDPETQQHFETLLRKLHSLRLDTDEKGEPEPFVLKLRPEAKQQWIAFYEQWAKKQAETEGELAAALAKQEGYAARFALIHHVVTRVEGEADDCDPIGRESVEAGITLARWFAYETERVYAFCKGTDVEREKQRLVEYIRSRGGDITARILHQANRSRYSTPKAAEAALEDLVKARLGNWVPTGEGGRPSRKFVLCEPTPYPKSPESLTDPGAKTPDSAGDDAPQATPEGSESIENRGQNDTFGANGVWGMTPQQQIERSEPPSEREEDPELFGISPQEDGESRTDEDEGELIL
ncbi:MAG: YfjI family protein [Gemmataceae bacterium]